ncbi:hypothetical protein POM88_050795 [Heracleum sosnowskyi]|uniref:Uncharacterized protein n=1 Tax=Heracleum sosnowskyi TaxID=360622 RepID=A0AAD8H0J7_9APIA|nr:hypothetical protein POM88_050795 [Heracleum sosnowskyi]
MALEGWPFFTVHDAIDLRQDRAQLTHQESQSQTYLSIRLRDVIPEDFDIHTERFSWANPGEFIGFFTLNENLVPEAVEQEGGEHVLLLLIVISRCVKRGHFSYSSAHRHSATCIPLSFCGSTNFQFGLMSTLSAGEMPAQAVSVDYLLNRFENFPEADKTFTNFLMAMHNDGFPNHQSFIELDEPLAQPPEHPQRYYVHWVEGFGPDDYLNNNLVAYADGIKDAVLYYGGVLAEFYMRDGFVPERNGRGPMQVHVFGDPGPQGTLVSGIKRKREEFAGPSQKREGGPGEEGGQGQGRKGKFRGGSSSRWWQGRKGRKGQGRKGKFRGGSSSRWWQGRKGQGKGRKGKFRGGSSSRWWQGRKGGQGRKGKFRGGSSSRWWQGRKGQGKGRKGKFRGGSSSRWWQGRKGGQGRGRKGKFRGGSSSRW